MMAWGRSTFQADRFCWLEHEVLADITEIIEQIKLKTLSHPISSSMTDSSNVELTIAFTDPELDPEELDAQVQNLLAQLQDLDEVTVDRVVDPNPPVGNKAGGAFWLAC